MLKRAISIAPQAASPHIEYAILLYDCLGRYDEAESLFQRAIPLDRNSDIAHGHYAVFLWQVRGNHELAEHHFKEALAAEAYSDFHGSYAGMLLALGRRDDGLGILERAMQLRPGAATLLECAFFRYAVSVQARLMTGGWKRGLNAYPQPGMRPSGACRGRPRRHDTAARVWHFGSHRDQPSGRVCSADDCEPGSLRGGRLRHRSPLVVW
jgi:tetratricopeptide (TPR) repeat protein